MKKGYQGVNLALARAFGERLHRYREDRGLSRRQLAMLAGIDPMQITRYERGRGLPAADSLAEISKALQISLDTLLLGKANREPEPPVKNPVLLQRLREVDGMVRHDQQILVEMIDALLARSQAENVAARRGKTA